MNYQVIYSSQFFLLLFYLFFMCFFKNINYFCHNFYLDKTIDQHNNLNTFIIMNEADQNTSVDDLQSEESADLTDLRKKLELSNPQMHELTYNTEKFLACIDQYNTNGIERVYSDELKQALIYFNENQKILEYAASCGKTIDRSTIIVTLHNQACVHQKLWDLQKSANYLEAIIYNINIYLQGLSDKKLDYLHYQPREFAQFQNITALAFKKQNFALYQLQFCAVNSQIRKHDISVDSAYSAIKVLKQTCKLTSILLRGEDQNKSNLSNRRIVQNRQMLQKLTTLEENLNPANYDNYLKKVSSLMSDKIQRSAPLEEECGSLKSFSIGKLMQLLPLRLSQFEQKPKIQDWLKYDNILMKALYLGVSYFTVGTELRFISSQSCEEGSQQYKNSIQFKTSQVYHLYAILIILTYVPLDTIFLSHLITSFNNHYMIDIQKLQKFVNPHKLNSPQKFSIEFISQKGLNKSLPQQQPNVNELPQSSSLKISPNEHLSERNSHNVKNSSQTNTQNNNEKKSQTSSTNKQEKVEHGRTKTTRIKNVEKITVIKKTEQVRQQHFSNKDKFKSNKSGSTENNPKSKKKIKTTIVQITPQVNPHHKFDKNQNKTQDTNQEFVSKSKARISREYLNSKNTHNQSKKKNQRQTPVKGVESSKSNKKNKNSSNTAKQDSKKIKCIYTVRNKIDQEPKKKKHSTSKSKSNSKKKVLKGKNKLALSGYNLNQRVPLPQHQNKSYLQKYNNDLLNSPRSQDLEEVFRDRAKLIDSKVCDQGILNHINMHESQPEQKPKSRSKVKQKQRIKMKKVFSKIKPLSSK